jgi:apolipoprotein N-acyltransferase
MKQQEKILKNPDYLSFLWLFIGAVLFIFANGLHIIPIAAWIAPIFIIRFSRAQKILRGSLIVLLVIIITQTIAWWGFFPIPDRKIYLLVSIIMGITVGIISSLPFIADRIMNSRLKGIISTLVFPITAVALFHLLSYRVGTWSIGAPAFSPYGSSQYGNLPLEQVVSIVGIRGLGFLIAWFASFANWCWEQEFKWVDIRKSAGIYFGIMVFLLIYGGARISFGYPEQNTVRIAGITIPAENSVSPERFTEVMVNKICPPIEKNIELLNRLTRQAAGAGANIVAWQEESVFLHKKDEKRFIDECCKLARNENIYLAVAYAVFNVSDLGENKAVFINPSGIVETEFLKHYLVQAESPYMKKGQGELPIMKTPYGNIALTICFEIYFSHYIQQAGRNGADIMLNLASDWKKVTPSNTYGITFSAIENGFSLVRCTGSGLSIATDYHGRVLSSMDYFTTKNGIMYADVPIKGIKTIYSYVGYLFGWLCVIGFCICVVLSIKKRKGGIS